MHQQTRVLPGDPATYCTCVNKLKGLVNEPTFYTFAIFCPFLQFRWARWASNAFLPRANTQLFGISATMSCFAQQRKQNEDEQKTNHALES